MSKKIFVLGILLVVVLFIIGGHMLIVNKVSQRLSTGGCSNFLNGDSIAINTTKLEYNISKENCVSIDRRNKPIHKIDINCITRICTWERDNDGDENE